MSYNMADLRALCDSILEVCSTRWKTKEDQLVDEFVSEFADHSSEIEEYAQFFSEKKRQVKNQIYRKGFAQLFHQVVNFEDTQKRHYDEYQKFCKEKIPFMIRSFNTDDDSLDQELELKELVDVVGGFLTALERGDSEHVVHS